MNSRKRVVVIGATGYICSQLLPSFRERYDLTLLDMKKKNPQGETLEEVEVVNLLDEDLDAHRPYFAGADAIVHCGFNRNPGPGGYHEGSAYRAERRNVDMCYHVFELAKMEGAKRVVVASSNHAADWYEPLLHAGQMDIVGPDTFPLADNFYGWAKATYEHLGFLYACGRRGSSLEIVMVRIGAPRPIELKNFVGRNPSAYKRDLGAWISPRDMAQLFVKSIETPDIRNEWGVPFQIFYGISDNARAFWSLVNARKVIGYAPQDDSEREYADDIRRFLHAGE